jgi:hypothetical protein
MTAAARRPGAHHAQRCPLIIPDAVMPSQFEAGRCCTFGQTPVGRLLLAVIETAWGDVLRGPGSGSHAAAPPTRKILDSRHTSQAVVFREAVRWFRGTEGDGVHIQFDLLCDVFGWDRRQWQAQLDIVVRKHTERVAA